MSDTHPNPAPRLPEEESQSGFAPVSGQQPPIVPAPYQPAFTSPSEGINAPSSGTRGMYTAAAIINWVTLAIVIVATFGIGIIAAAWFIPMTVLTHKAAKGPYKHTALGVCTLLFVNIISGILMLVDDSNRPPKPVR